MYLYINKKYVIIRTKILKKIAKVISVPATYFYTEDDTFSRINIVI